MDITNQQHYSFYCDLFSYTQQNWVNWMKCHVKIDAIECLPCYLKVSFYHENDDQREYPFSIIRLNIPGVRVGSAASRTKSFTYGVFWKNNRKRCRLFLAFQDKQSCSMHMKWLKRSIESLEFYRKGSSLSLSFFARFAFYFSLLSIFVYIEIIWE